MAKVMTQQTPARPDAPNNITVVAAYTALMVHRKPTPRDWRELDAELKRKAQRGLTLEAAMRELAHGRRYERWLKAICLRLSCLPSVPLSSVIARQKLEAAA